MSNNILFIFEGQNAEKQILDNLTKFYFNENTVITCAYCSTIYQVYKSIIADDDLDTFNLLKNRNQNKDILKDYTRNDFAEIYMFFDYDGHDSVANDSKLQDLLEFFNEETDKGKLYISYPMIESLKHIIDYDSFKTLKVECKKNINYKYLVSETCIVSLKNFTTYSKKTWKSLINVHLIKLNFLINEKDAFPEKIISQIEIFEKQLEKHINIDSTVSVLNSYPVFLHDYYGNENIKILIS